MSPRASDSSTPNSSASEGNSRLPRGSACQNCKRRRVKCDGKRPVCSPCLRYPGQELYDCEFLEGQPPRAQILQERIFELEDRIGQLQGYGGAPDAVRLNPANPLQSSSVYHPPANPAPHETQLYPEDLKTLPPSKIHSLLNHFSSFAYEVGFFMDPARFMRSAMLQHDVGHPLRPCPSLLYSVCLWAAKSLPASIKSRYEEVLLEFALRYSTEDITANSTPRQYLQVLQAEILLSTYLLNNNRLLEGSYHANVASSMAVSTKSYLVRSATGVQQSFGDSVEEGEWVDAFWTTVSLNCYWVLVNEQQSSTFFDQLPVDTPWPLNNYRQEKLIPASHKTMQKFLNGIQDTGYSALALHAKAAILLKKAIDTSKRSDSGESQQISTVVGALDSLVMLLPKPDGVGGTQQRLLATHLMTQVAIIKLHKPRAPSSSTSRHKCVGAARTIADLARYPNGNPFGVINPVIGVIWYTAYDVLVIELQYQRGQGRQDDSRLTSAISQLRQRIEADGLHSPLAASYTRSNHA